MMDFIFRYLAKKAKLPTGLLGRLAGRKMTEVNADLIRWTLDHLDLHPSDDVLEIGFGPGLGIRWASERAAGGKVVGVELSEDMIEEARRSNAVAIAAGRVELVHGDASELPFDEASFDKAFGVNVVYFWDDPIATLREIKRVLRPGGRLALGFVAKQGLARSKVAHPEIFTLYSAPEAERLLGRAGFKDVSVHRAENHPQGTGLCAIGTT